MEELRKKLIMTRIARNITIAVFSILAVAVIFLYIWPNVDDFRVGIRMIDKNMKFIAAIPVVVVIYLVAFGFNRVINKNIMVDVLASIDSRLVPVSFSNFFNIKGDLHNTAINNSGLLPYVTDMPKITRTIVLDIENQASILMTDFSVEDSEKGASPKANFKGAMIAFTCNNININGSAVFFDKSFYEQYKNRHAFEKYSVPASYSISNSKIDNEFYMYFSNDAVAKIFNNNNILEAISAVKESFNRAKLSISFVNNAFYILVEKENIKLTTDKNGFDVFASRVKSAINLYDVLKQV